VDSSTFSKRTKNENKNMRAIYFIEKKDGIKLYKCDTFWSQSEKITDAKIHDDSKYDQKRFFDSLTLGFVKSKWHKEPEWSDEDYNIIKGYERELYGYQTVLDSTTPETAWTLKEDTKLSEPIYLTQIISISRSGEVDSPTFESYSRDNKINQIIN